jgi:glycerol kinase
LGAATLIAVDAGTTGVTALLLDSDLRPLARAYREFPQAFPAPGRVEHDAAQILAAVDRVLEKIASAPGAARAVALGVTNQRETVFALDRASGRALAPGIVWQDRRTAARCAELAERGAAELVRERSGLVLDPYFSATKIEWMLRETPGLAARAAAGEVVFATVDALVVHHLSGTFATDPTNAARTMLFSLARRAWDAELCALFGVAPTWLPEVRPSTGDFGAARIPGLGRELPIRGVAGDQQAALFGQGCFDAGALKITFGTGCFLLLNTGARRVDSSAGLLTTLALDRRGAPCFAIEGSVFVAGALIQWLRDQLGIIARASDVEALAASVPDSGGVTIVPAFAGLGAPHWDSGARGAILGLTRGSGRAHIARAALEAIALQNAELIELLRAESGLEVAEVLADGGAAANDLLMQLSADFAGARFRRPVDVEATARGAAALAGLAAGLWSDLADAGALRERPQEFEPSLSERARAACQAEWRAAVKRVRTN